MPLYDVIKDTYPGLMHLIGNLFDHLIKTTTRWTPNCTLKAVNIQPLPDFVERERKQGESKLAHTQAVESERKDHDSRAAAVQACIELYKAFGLDEKGRYEVCRRFKSIKTLPNQIGTGSPYKNFGKLNTASAHFFMRYCSWIYDDIPGLALPQKKTIKQMFALAKLCMRRTLPCKVEDGLGDFIVQQVHYSCLLQGIP